MDSSRLYCALVRRQELEMQARLDAIGEQMTEGERQTWCLIVRFMLLLERDWVFTRDPAGFLKGE